MPKRELTPGRGVLQMTTLGMAGAREVSDCAMLTNCTKGSKRASSGGASTNENTATFFFCEEWPLGLRPEEAAVAGASDEAAC